LKQAEDQNRLRDKVTTIVYSSLGFFFCLQAAAAAVAAAE